MAQRSIFRSPAAQRASTLLLALTLTVGCAQSQGEKVRDARIAQIDAREQVKLHTAERRARASSAAVEQEHTALGQAVGKANQPGVLATTELVEVSKERAKYQTEVKARMESLTIRLEASKEKIDVLGPHAPTALFTLFQTAKTEHDDLQQDVAKVGSVPPDNWASFSDSIDQRMSTLDRRLSELNDEIHDV